MRIRKHAQRSQTCCLPLSSQLPSPDNRCSTRESPPTRVCELNRSPWDVISFTSEVLREDDSGGETEGAGLVESINGTWKDISCTSSSPSPPIILTVSGRERRKDETNSKAKKQLSFRCCNKTDGKGWKCKKEAKRGHSLCEHHLAQLKSYYTNNKSSTSSYLSGRGLKSINGAQASAANNGYRGKRSSSKTPSSNYYYYTGFGPLWGKGRVESKNRDMEMEVDSGFSSSTPSVSSGSDDDDDDDDDNDTEGEDDGNVGKKKRGRKPVKTRSLKSLL